ncbi:MAG TPA: hypothetical protein VLX58_17670 [Bryobacteraceae bacterium]|nr:hypothetical protein [Bryobacteraceae bacterium]
MRPFRSAALPFLAAWTAALPAQPAQQAASKPPLKPVQAQSSSTIRYSPGADGSETVEIRNVTYEITETQVPGRPSNERLLLCKTAHSKQNLGDIGEDASVALEVWRLGDDPRQKPLYSLTTTGVEGHTLDNALFIVSRGVEEVEWWSVYGLGSGRHFFDTYVPLVSFSISRETVTTRYAGLEVPPDDVGDARLKQANVVAVLSYASGDRLLREALLTCDDPQQARLLRSYADVTRRLSLEEETAVANTGKGPAAEPRRTLRLSFRQNYPSPANTVDVLIPLMADDLDLAHARLPARMHANAWQR